MSPQPKDEKQSRNPSELRTDWARRRTDLAKKRTQRAQRRTEMADQRTDWALRRTIRAAERTFSAWIRTGISAEAAGLGIARLIRIADRNWIPKTMGAALVLIGSGAFAAALWRYHRRFTDLKGEDSQDMVPFWLMSAMVVGLLGVSVLAFILLFVEAG